MNTFQRVLCVECKTNYGSEQRQGMCNVCFKSYERKISVEEPQYKETEPETVNVVPEIVTEQKVEVTEKTELETNKVAQKSKFHCFKCETKVGYLGFQCKCDYIFCGKHRHFSEHGCTFDFKNYDRQKLSKKNEK